MRVLFPCAVVLLAGCRIQGVRPTPLRGPQPASLVIAPIKDLTGSSAVGPFLLAGAESAFRERGYRVLPLGVGHDLIARERLLPIVHLEAPDLGRVRQALDVDAVLLLEVRGWDAETEPFDAASWDLRWRIVSTADGRELWDHDERGRWHRPRGEPIDPTLAPGAERNVQPFGTRAEASYRSPADLATALHRTAASQLPRRMP